MKIANKQRNILSWRKRLHGGGEREGKKREFLKTRGNGEKTGERSIKKPLNGAPGRDGEEYRMAAFKREEAKWHLWSWNVLIEQKRKEK